jgi:hypothetical protein
MKRPVYSWSQADWDWTRSCPEDTAAPHLSKWTCPFAKYTLGEYSTHICRCMYTHSAGHIHINVTNTTAFSWHHKTHRYFGSSWLYHVLTGIWLHSTHCHCECSVAPCQVWRISLLLTSFAAGAILPHCLLGCEIRFAPQPLSTMIQLDYGRDTFGSWKFTFELMQLVLFTHQHQPLPPRVRIDMMSLGINQRHL